MKYKLLLIFALAIQISAIELPIYEARYSYESEEINIKGVRKIFRIESNVILDMCFI